MGDRHSSTRNIAMYFAQSKSIMFALSLRPELTVWQVPARTSIVPPPRKSEDHLRRRERPEASISQSNGSTWREARLIFP
jgi:hypothetical protein